MAIRKDGTLRARRKDWEPVAEMMERLSIPEPNTGCWAWLGKHGTGGYAYVAYREGGKRYHRKAATVAYELKYGAVPDGLELGHSCFQEWCVNPDHVRPVTHSQNMRERRPFDNRTWGGLCKAGHVLPPMSERSKNGSCPVCYREYQRTYRLAHKTKV